LEHVAGGASIDSLAYRQLITRAGEARSVGELFATASRRLRRLVPFDAAVWLASDPATGLPTAPSQTENMDGFGLEACLRVWELEFMVEDVNRYAALARAPAPAAGLRQATGDSPGRSARYRDVLRPHGFVDELRGVLRAGGEPWGLLALFRRAGEPGFDAGESAIVARLSAPLGAAVRDHARPEASPFAAAAPGGPGLLLFAPSGELISVNDDARAWLDELTCDGDAADGDAFEMPLPLAVVSTLMRARAIAEDRDRGSARARIRSRSTGRWLVCHASCLRDANGGIGDTALVIEPAKASEIAPIITQAYGLSPREQEITGLLARGVSTADIAKELSLSAHTVRDYIKTTLDKVGVSSRGELVAKLFAEHHAPVHFERGNIERARPAA
jgi:DNA-binding CsgD family transcriptional regulator